MKKLVSKICMLLFMSMIMILSLNTSKVSASDESFEVVSYHQGIVMESENKYAGFTALSQYYYKIRNDLGQKEDGEFKPAIAYRSGPNQSNSNESKHYKDLSKDSEICSILSSSYCKDGNLKGELARVTISNYGNVGVYLADGVTISNLRFYYIIANYSNSAQLFCNIDGDVTRICEAAQTISGTFDGMQNWKDKQKDGSSMVFSSNNIDDYFESSVISATGATVYSGYNIITNMNVNYKKLAETYGAYVVSSFTIEYKGTKYYLNYNLESNNFNSVGNFDKNYEVSNTSTCPSNQITSSDGCLMSISMLSNGAVLVKTKDGSNATDNKAYNEISNYFTEIGIPALKIIIVLLFLVVGTTTIVTIVKSSDEPEVRHAEIKKFIGMFVGAVIIYLILEFYEEIISAVSGWFE